MSVGLCCGLCFSHDNLFNFRIDVSKFIYLFPDLSIYLPVFVVLSSIPFLSLCVCLFSLCVCVLSVSVHLPVCDSVRLVPFFVGKQCFTTASKQLGNSVCCPDLNCSQDVSE